MESHRAEEGRRRELVVWSTTGRWRWVLVKENGEIQAGWADTFQRGMVELALAKNPDPVPHVTRRPRTTFQLVTD